METGVDFDLLDKRSLDPVGYKRVNKRAGKGIDKQRAEAGRTEKVQPLEDAGAPTSTDNLVDLTELLKRSLGSRKAEPASAAKPTGKPARKTAARKRA